MYQSRIKSKKNRSDRFQKKRTLEIPDANNDTYFGIVKEMLGNGRVRIFCEDGTLKIGRIRGSMRKSRGKTIIDKEDLVMVASRDFDDKLDIMYKYTQEEVAQILKDYEIPEKIYKSLTESDFCRVDGADDTILFCNEDDAQDSDDDDPRAPNAPKSAQHSTVENDDIEDIDIDAI